jgi:hypothetical protein
MGGNGIGGNGLNGNSGAGTQPGGPNYAGLSAYLQNGKSQKAHMNGGQAVAIAQIRHSSLRNQLKGKYSNTT